MEGMMKRMMQVIVGVMMIIMMMGMVKGTPTSCSANLDYLNTTNRDYLALMVDASGKAVDDLGKWDECRDLGKDVAKYCTIRFFLNISIPTPYIGLCLPVNCTASDFSEMGIDYLKLAIALNHGNPVMEAKFTAVLYLYESFLSSQNKSAEYQYECIGDTPSVFSDGGGVAMFIISILIATLVVLGTLLDGFDANWWPEPDTTVSATGLGGIQDTAEVQPLLHKSARPRSKMFDFMVAFSIARNFKALVGPSPPALAFLNGMRAISITWVILGHSLDYMNYAGVTNFAHVITQDVQHASAQVFPGAEFSVDSFFWLSGFLVTYLTVKELRTKKRVNWFLYYFHRVWRLSPAYFYALFFYICISVYMSNGPMWPRYMDQVEHTCGKYWWTNLLYINNFIPHTWQSQCFLWGWYLAVDMQLYIVAPIIFMAYHKNKVVGWVIVALGVVATVVANGVIASQHSLVWNATDPHVYMSLVYGKPYTRAAPWLLGIGCAFLYLEQKQMKRIVVYVGWAISAAVMLLCVYGPANQFEGGSSELDPPKNTWGHGSKSWTYFTFAKLGWSLALSFLMYSMAMGWGGIVRRFLGASIWNPLARLTYSTYLFHPIIMFVVYYSHLQYFSYDQYFISIVFVGIMFLSFCTAAVIFLAIERPMTNMEKLLIPHKKH